MNKIYLLAAAAFVGVAACSPSAEKAPDTDTAVVEPGATPTSPSLTPEQAAQQTNSFASAAANADMLEIETSRVAQTKSKNADVKAFAAMLVRDHTATTAELKTWSGSSGVTLPTAPDDGTKVLIDNIRNADATGFDDKYLDTVIDAHEAAIAKFDTYAREGQDSALKTWATATLVKLRTHLDQANAIRAAVNRT
jgi:putative membrane protein